MPVQGIVELGPRPVVAKPFACANMICKFATYQPVDEVGFG
jgi:hypothetical protein